MSHDECTVLTAASRGAATGARHLAGRTALVLDRDAGTDGLIARGLARAGADVAVVGGGDRRDGGAATSGRSLVQAAVRQVVETYGGVDVVVLAGSAPDSFALVEAALPSLRRSSWARLLAIAPPWERTVRTPDQHGCADDHVLSLLTLALAAQYRSAGILANCLWSSTSGVSDLTARAAVQLLARSAADGTGRCYLDSDVA